MSTRPRVDSLLRAWAIVALAFWVFVAFAVAGAGTSSAAESPVEVDQRRSAPQTSLDEVSRTIRCPTCDGTLDRSDSPAADRMRAWITPRVDAGWTEAEIRDGLVAEYGGDESILAVPRAGGIGIGAWLVPLLIVLAIIAAGVVVPRRWRRDRPAASSSPGQTTSSSSSSHASS